jgi:hypothetical protein
MLVVGDNTNNGGNNKKINNIKLKTPAIYNSRGFFVIFIVSVTKQSLSFYYRMNGFLPVLGTGMTI